MRNLQNRHLTLIIFLVVVITVYLFYINSFQRATDSSTEIQFKSLNVIENFAQTPPNLLSIDFEGNDYYIFDARLCPNNGENITVMILVATAPLNKIKRGYIRKTWGHYGTRSDIGFAFVIGHVVNETLANDLQNENLLYNDIIRVNFYDSYNNLTLKSISSLNWLDRFCNRTRFYLKSDDDVFVNIPKLLEFTDAHQMVNRTIFGHLAINWTPFRDPQSQYYVSKTEYPPKVFEPFTTGPAYLMTFDCVHDLFNKSLYISHPLKLEDVFITGIVASQLNITRVDVKEFTNNNKTLGGLNLTIHNAITKHDLSFRDQFDMWMFLEL